MEPTVRIGPFVLLTLLAAAVSQSALSEPYLLDNHAIEGVITSRMETTLAAEVAGPISSMRANEKRRFRKGELLLEIDCAVRQAQLQKAEAELKGANNRHAGNQRLAEHSAISETDLQASAIEVEKAAADRLQLKTLVDKCRITAPFDGRVAEKRVELYQFVQSGEPLLDYIDDRHLELEFIIPTHWLPWFVPGYRFQLSINDNGQQRAARLEYVTARADPVSQSIRAVATLEGEIEGLVPGMSGTIENIRQPAVKQGE